MLLFMYIAVCFEKWSVPCISIFIFCHIFSVFLMKFFPVFSMNSFPVGCPVQISLGNAFYFNTYSGIWNAYRVRGSEQYHIQGTYFVLPNTAFPKLSWPENPLWSPSFLYITSLSSKTTTCTYLLCTEHTLRLPLSRSCLKAWSHVFFLGGGGRSIILIPFQWIYFVKCKFVEYE